VRNCCARPHKERERERGPLLSARAIRAARVAYVASRCQVGSVRVMRRDATRHNAVQLAASVRVLPVVNISRCENSDVGWLFYRDVTLDARCGPACLACVKECCSCVCACALAARTSRGAPVWS